MKDKKHYTLKELQEMSMKGYDVKITRKMGDVNWCLKQIKQKK